MEIYLIFNLKTFLFIFKNKKKFLKNNKYIILTDKIFIFNYLKDNNFNVVNLALLINEKKRNDLFIKFYKFFDKRLKKSNNNFFYNLNRCQVARDYAGSKLIEYVIKKFILKKKIKKINYFNDLNGKIFTPAIYNHIFKLISKKNKFEYNSEKILLGKKPFKKILNNWNKIKSFFNNLELLKIKIFLLNISRYFNNCERLLVIKPANDLRYLPLVQKKFVFYINANEVKDEFIQFNIENKNTSNIENYVFDFLKEQEKNYKEKYDNFYKELKYFIKKKKIKKIFWGLSPTPIMRNVFTSLMKENFKVYGTQHGGKCFLLKDSTVHSDGEYDYCNNYLSYGVSKKFDYKFIKSKHFNIVNVGSLNSIINRKKDLKKMNLNNILFLPTPVSHFHCPLIESSQSKFFELQINICKELNLNSKNKNFIKLIYGVPKKLMSDNQELLELNPISSKIKKFKNIQQKRNNFKNLLKKLKPQIIILDSLSTTIYEAIESNSEVILFLDKINLPYDDVMKKLSKRVFIVENVKEMKKTIKEITKKKKTKLDNNEFNNEFYTFKEKKFNSLKL